MNTALLILCLLLAVHAQFIKQNTWKVGSCQRDSQVNFRKVFAEKKGSAIIFQGSTLLTIVLLHSSDYQYQLVAGEVRNVIINIDFAQVTPQNFGKVQGKFNVSISSGGRQWWGMRRLVYSGSQVRVNLKGCELEVQIEGAAYIRLILLSICLAGINILLLTVLVKRKRWSQVQPLFLMVLFGWQAKKLLILWFQCRFFCDNGDNSSYVTIMKYLLIILSIKSIKIFAEIIHISTNIIKDAKLTIGLALSMTVLFSFLPMDVLHLLVPACFYLQFRKYSKYSRLDFEVHYALINLNLFLNAQLFYRLLTYQSSISPLTIFLAAYSVLCRAATVIMGELYQYSPQNNKSSPCITVDFDNKRFCPECQDELYEEEGHDGSKSKERHDLSYDLWKFGVAECGHIFHTQCLKKLLRLQKGCPLIRRQDSSAIDKPNFDVALAEESKMV